MIEKYSFDTACIQILKESKNIEDASKKIMNEIMATVVAGTGQTTYDILKDFYQKNFVEPQNDIKTLISQNDLLINEEQKRNGLFAQQVKNQYDLIKALREKGII
jgi:hypothetical protein